VKYLDKAKKYAQNHSYPKNLDYRLCAVLVKGNKIISIGYNRFGYSGLIRYYNKQPYEFNIHAEVAAILKVRNKIDLTGCEIYVVRIMRHDPNSVGMSMPCEMCQAVLTAYGISKAYFTVDNNSIGMLEFNKPKVNQ
jgi:deoxycytidylate deaminase